MRTGTTATEHDEFQGAVALATAKPNDRAPAIETMMRLSLEATALTLRRWASAWLLKNIGLTVRHAEDEDFDHAAPPEAANLR